MIDFERVVFGPPFFLVSSSGERMRRYGSGSRCGGVLPVPHRVLSSLVSGLLLFCSTVSGVAQQQGVPAMPFPARDLVEGTQVDERQCAEHEGAVWVSHKLGTECLATYASHPAPKSG